MKNQSHFIRKQDGTSQPLNREKFIQSLMRSGLSATNAAQVASDVLSDISPGVSTRELKRKTHAILYRKHPVAAGRYRLKDALMKLGPTGFPFEHLMAQLLQKKGYQTHVGAQLQGRCIAHEVDVLAESFNSVWLMECKYHNQPHVKSDVKVPLYVKSRFDDLRHQFDTKNIVYSAACNTRFSDDAITYARCAGMQLISWNYPEAAGLNHMLDHYRLYPVTILRWLHRSEVSTLFEQHIYSISDLIQSERDLSGVITDPVRRRKILDEAIFLSA